MKERFSAPEIARRRPCTLAAFLARHGIRTPDETAFKLIAFASGALPPAPNRLAALQRTLAATVDLRECLTLNANGQHGIFAGARRYLRLLRTLVLNQVPYLDPRSRSSTASDQDRADAALQAWIILIRKWRTIPDGIELIAKETNPLSFWRRVVMESRSVHLPVKP